MGRMRAAAVLRLLCVVFGPTVALLLLLVVGVASSLVCDNFDLFDIILHIANLDSFDVLLGLPGFDNTAEDF